MDGDDAGGELLAASASPRDEEAIAAVQDGARLPPTTPSDEGYDELYGDVNVGFPPLLPLSLSPAPTSQPKTPSPGPSPSHVGFLPLLPLSPSPAPTSPPKTPSPGPGPFPSSSPPPHRAPAPETPAQRQPEPEPQPKPTTPRPPSPPPSPRHHMSYYSPPRCTALYISELDWWTTDAEVEAALAPHGASLCGLHFYSDKLSGRSYGICRADFLRHAAAASAAAALHGHAFHGRHCVASLSRPPALNRLALADDFDSHAEAARVPNPTRGNGYGRRRASDAASAQGNVGPVLGDRRPPPMVATPPASVVPRPPFPGPSFGGIMGSAGGYGGFHSIGQYNAGIGNGMMPSAVALHGHMNAAFLAARGMPMRGSTVWHDQGNYGGLWGPQQQWNFGGYQMPWQRPMQPRQRHQAQHPTQPRQHHQGQQPYGNGDYEKGHGMKQKRPNNRSEERSIGNVRHLDRRQADRDGDDRYKEHGREKGHHQKHVLENERDRERHWNERDRHGGDKRRCHEYTEHADTDWRGRTRSRSQSMDDSDDDRPRRRR